MKGLDEGGGLNWDKKGIWDDNKITRHHSWEKAMNLGTVSVWSVEGLCREEEDIQGMALRAGLGELPPLSLGHILLSPSLPTGPCPYPCPRSSWERAEAITGLIHKNWRGHSSWKPNWDEWECSTGKLAPTLGKCLCLLCFLETIMQILNGMHDLWQSFLVALVTCLELHCCRDIHSLARSSLIKPFIPLAQNSNSPSWAPEPLKSNLTSKQPLGLGSI